MVANVGTGGWKAVGRPFLAGNNRLEDGSGRPPVDLSEEQPCDSGCCNPPPPPPSRSVVGGLRRVAHRTPTQDPLQSAMGIAEEM